MPTARAPREDKWALYESSGLSAPRVPGLDKLVRKASTRSLNSRLSRHSSSASDLLSSSDASSLLAQPPLHSKDPALALPLLRSLLRPPRTPDSHVRQPSPVRTPRVQLFTPSAEAAASSAYPSPRRGVVVGAAECADSECSSDGGTTVLTATTGANSPSFSVVAAAAAAVAAGATGRAEASCEPECLVEQRFDLAAFLEEFYREHNPGMVAHASKVAASWVGEEAELYRRMLARYPEEADEFTCLLEVGGGCDDSE